MTAPAAAPAAQALATIRGGLIVSCQAPADDPASGPAIMRAIALSVIAGGAVAIRAEGLDDLRAIRDATTVPLIGLWKDGAADVYITPTVEHAMAVAGVGVELVAVDATGRERPDARPLQDTIDAVHGAGTGVMADIASIEDARVAADLGADAIATTLSGYTRSGGTADADGPDLPLLEALAGHGTTPVIAEGRYTTPGQVRRAFDAGAWAVVVGTAITRPQVLTRGFVAAVPPRGA